MRTAKPGGPCAQCGKADAGLYWHTVYKVLDFGVPDIPPIEPAMMTPILCDDCDIVRRFVEGHYPMEWIDAPEFRHLKAKVSAARL